MLADGLPLCCWLQSSDCGNLYPISYTLSLPLLLAAELRLRDFRELKHMRCLTALTSLWAGCRPGVDLEIDGDIGGALPRSLRRLSLATGGWLGMTVPAGNCFPELGGQLEECLLAYVSHEADAESPMDRARRLLQPARRPRQVLVGELEWLPLPRAQEPNVEPAVEARDSRCIATSSYRQLVSFVSWQQGSDARFSDGSRSGEKAFKFQPRFPARQLTDAAEKGILERFAHWADSS